MSVSTLLTSFRTITCQRWNQQSLKNINLLLFSINSPTKQDLKTRTSTPRQLTLAICFQKLLKGKKGQNMGHAPSSLSVNIKWFVGFQRKRNIFVKCILKMMLNHIRPKGTKSSTRKHLLCTIYFQEANKFIDDAPLSH